MKTLKDCENDIHSCSKCGLCQSVCPIYKITGNDCTVSRGHFIMLRGLLKGELKMSGVINRYLDLCLKCGACTKFCPSDIDVVNIVTLAKAEYFNTHPFEKLFSVFQKIIVFKIGLKILSLFNKKPKSKTFDRKILYFGGCGVEINGKMSKFVVKTLNECGYEVIIPNFDCCGLPFLMRGDIKNFERYMKSFYSEIEKYDNCEILTTCASCEKILNQYKNYDIEKSFTVKNIYAFLREHNIQFTLKKDLSVTFHKPCNINNYDDIKWLFNNTKNLKYTEMEDYDKCCGMNGVFKLRELQTMFSLYKAKREKIIDSGSNIVLTSCLGCENALRWYSFGKYKVKDAVEFYYENT